MRADVELAGLVELEDLGGDHLRIGERHPLLAGDPVDELDDQLAVLAAQHVAALAADADQLDRLALVQQLGDPPPAPRTIELLKPPHRPRSEVATTIRWVSSLPRAGEQRRCAWQAAHRAREVGQHRAPCFGRTGRDASACSWARCSLAAATIFMAFVIFCVGLTLRDPALEFLEAGHRQAQAKRLAKSSMHLAELLLDVLA